MHDSNKSSDETNPTQPMFPRRPKLDDSRWRDVVVRARTQPQADIKRLPVHSKGGTLGTVYVGDTMSIIPELQYEFWVAAKVGYHVGWINIRDVKLISLRSRTQRFLEETKPIDPIRAPVPPDTSHRSYAETETQPSPPVQRQEEIQTRRSSPLGRKDINRLINHLKGLGGGLFKKSSNQSEEPAEA